MNVVTLPSPPRRPLVRWLLALVLPGSLLALSVLTLDFASFDASWRGLGEFVAPLLAPNLEPRFLLVVARASAETLAMAVLSTIFAALLAALLAVLAQTALRWPLKLLFNALRAVPELLFASLLVLAVGLGATAGILALTLHTAGVLARLFSETLENADRRADEALRLVGAGRLQAFCYGRLPIIAPQWFAYSLYRSEMNLRAATVLGVVGAGGLGQQLHVALSVFRYDKVSTLLLATFLLIWLTESLSRGLRRDRFSSAQID
ncbi:MAG: phosphonate ABC transporter, permease protein PhnE [Pseudomonadota bacterium]